MTIVKMAWLAAPMLLGATAQASSMQQNDLQVVGSRMSAATWRAEVARDLGANVSAPRPTIGAPPEGMVKVMFGADARGRIDRISVVEPSASPSLDRAAMIAVRRMRTLRAPPAGIEAAHAIQAWVYFANTEAAADRYRAALLRTKRGDMALDDHMAPLLVGVRG